jgi:hypothetical protein
MQGGLSPVCHVLFIVRPRQPDADHPNRLKHDCGVITVMQCVYHFPDS